MNAAKWFAVILGSIAAGSITGLCCTARSGAAKSIPSAQTTEPAAQKSRETPEPDQTSFSWRSPDARVREAWAAAATERIKHEIIITVQNRHNGIREVDRHVTDLMKKWCDIWAAGVVHYGLYDKAKARRLVAENDHIEHLYTSYQTRTGRLWAMLDAIEKDDWGKDDDYIRLASEHERLTMELVSAIFNAMQIVK